SNGAITTPIACSRPLPRHLVAIISLDNQRPPTLTLFPYTTLFRSTLTNSSTAAVGVNVALGRTLSAGSVVNNAGATIANDGTLRDRKASCRERVKISRTAGLMKKDGVTNSGDVKAEGGIKGPSTNQNAGTFTVTGNLVGNSKQEKAYAVAQCLECRGVLGRSTLTNSSTAAVGVNVALGRTLSAGSVVNNAGATIANDGTL